MGKKKQKKKNVAAVQTLIGIKGFSEYGLSIFIARWKGLKPLQVFSYTNTVSKVLSEQGFDVHRMKKPMIKRLIALYFDASLTGENIPDYDGEQYFDLKEVE